MTYLLLFYEFFKTGLFAVGGGMATLPFLYDMSARHSDWFSASQIADMVAVSESTPGPIGVNMATYVGFQVGSVPGAVVATIGLVTPSIIVILIIAAFLRSFRDSKLVNSVFYGLRPASAAMVAAAGLGVAVLSSFSLVGYEERVRVLQLEQPIALRLGAAVKSINAAGTSARTFLSFLCAYYGQEERL